MRLLWLGKIFFDPVKSICQKNVKLDFNHPEVRDPPAPLDSLLMFPAYFIEIGKKWQRYGRKHLCKNMGTRANFGPVIR